MALSTNTKSVLDSLFGPGGAAKFVALNASGTDLDGQTRDKLSQVMGGIGEAVALEATVKSANGAVTVSQAAKNRLQHYLRGDDALADFLANGNA